MERSGGVHYIPLVSHPFEALSRLHKVRLLKHSSLGKWRESLHQNRDSFSIQMKESSFACSVISGKCDRYLNASSNLYPLMKPSSTASWTPVGNTIPLSFFKCLLPMHSDSTTVTKMKSLGGLPLGDKLSEIFSTNPARKFSNCPAWLPPITVIPFSGFSWPKATKQGPHVALGGELPVGVLNGSCCPLADNLDREYPNPGFSLRLRCWQPWLISTLTLQCFRLHWWLEGMNVLAPNSISIRRWWLLL